MLYRFRFDTGAYASHLLTTRVSSVGKMSSFDVIYIYILYITHIYIYIYYIIIYLLQNYTYIYYIYIYITYIYILHIYIYYIYIYYSTARRWWFRVIVGNLFKLPPQPESGSVMK